MASVGRVDAERAGSSGAAFAPRPDAVRAGPVGAGEGTHGPPLRTAYTRGGGRAPLPHHPSYYMDNSTFDTARRAYRAPSVARLGSLVDVTAGPESGSIDQLVGASGGFQTPPPDPS